MSRITKEEIEKTKCGRFLLSDENIYLSIYSLNSYVFEYNLLNTEDRILYHQLQDKFDTSSLNGDRKMFDALTYQEMLKEIKKNSEKYGITDDVVAILITRPDLATGKDILNSLEYYHFRTGHSINFYLPGYGAYWTEEEYPDGKVVTEIAGVKWSFSNQRFVEFIEDMEKYSKWRYSGESDLIFAEVKNGRLSYERAMEFHLDNMLRDKAIISVNQFFEKIVRIGQEGRSMNQIGNKLGIDKGKQVVFDALLEKMPMHMGDVIKQEKYFCVKNIQK